VEDPAEFVRVLKPKHDAAIAATKEALEGLGWRSKYFVGKMKPSQLLLEVEAEKAKRRVEEDAVALRKLAEEGVEEADVPREFEYFSDTENVSRGRN